MKFEGVSPVFYFTGTGGSLYAAKRIAAALPGHAPVPIAALMGEAEIIADADAAGFVFPLYYTGLPRIVAGFVRKLSFAKPCRVFAVVLCGRPRGNALHQLDALLRRRGAVLSAGFYLPTQSNYLPYNELTDRAATARRVEAGERKLGEILAHLRNGDRSVEEDGAFYLRVAYRFLIRRSEKYDRYFHTNENCSSCGICARVCPVDNIELAEGRPKWLHRCQFCLACIHYCPQRAIQWKDVTQGRGRYHYKGISAAEVAGQKRPL
jgi:ferredoxin